MTPHEETWEVFTSGVLVAVHDVATKHLRANVNYKADRAALVAAAPEMARALSDLMVQRGPDDAHRHTDACWDERNMPGGQRLDGPCTPNCRRMRALLHKAGVLP